MGRINSIAHHTEPLMWFKSLGLVIVLVMHYNYFQYLHRRKILNVSVGQGFGSTAYHSPMQ